MECTGPKLMFGILHLILLGVLVSAGAYRSYAAGLPPLSPPAQALLDRADVRTALRHAQDHHEENIAKQIAISEIPSSPFAEQDRAGFMASEFKRIGLTDVRMDGVGNVLGWRRGTLPRILVVAAHLDTVFPKGTDFKVKRTGTRLAGPGIEDDSRGLAVIVGAVEALNAAKIMTGVTLLFVADVGEEGVANLRGIKYLFEKGEYGPKLDAFISVDAPGATIVNREIGSRRYRVTLSGPGGHSWINFGRPNPAHAVGRIMAAIADLEVPSDPDKNLTSYNVGIIGGGTAVNAIPAEAWFEFDMRSVNEEELIRLEQRFLSIVQRGVDEENRFSARHAKNVFAKGEITADLKLLAVRHAVSGAVNAPLVQAASRAVRELGLGDPLLVAASTDSNPVAILGKPAMTIGGGGQAANLHSLEEWFDSKDAYRGVQLLILTILNYDQN